MALNVRMGIKEVDFGLVGVDFNTRGKHQVIQYALEFQGFLNRGLTHQHSVIHKLLMSYGCQRVVEMNAP